MQKVDINGKEYTKKQLLEKVYELEKEEKRVEYESWVLKEIGDGRIGLYKDDLYVKTVAHTERECEVYNINNLSRNMARAMGDLMSLEDRIGRVVTGYAFKLQSIRFSECFEWASAYLYAEEKDFITKELCNVSTELWNKWLIDCNKLFGLRKEDLCKQ